MTKLNERSPMIVKKTALQYFLQGKQSIQELGEKRGCSKAEVMGRLYAPNQSEWEQFARASTAIGSAVPPMARAWMLMHLVHQTLQNNMGTQYNKAAVVKADTEFCVKCFGDLSKVELNREIDTWNTHNPRHIIVFLKP